MKYNSSTEYKSCFHIFQSIRLFWNVGVLPGGNHCHSQKDCCVGSYNDGDKLRISAISYLVIADTKLCVCDLKVTENSQKSTKFKRYWRIIKSNLERTLVRNCVMFVAIVPFITSLINEVWPKNAFFSEIGILNSKWFWIWNAKITSYSFIGIICSKWRS